MRKIVYGAATILCLVVGGLTVGMRDCQAKQKIVFDNVDGSKLSMVVGDSYRVKLNRKKLGKKGKVIYSSSNKRLATVNKKGKIKARRAGKVKIIVRVKDKDIKKSIRVKVRKPVLAKKVRIVTKEKYVFAGESLLLQTKVKPAKELDEELIWSSSKENIAVVSNTGEVRGISAGKATITVKTSKSHKKVKKRITVRKNEIKSFRFLSSKEVVGLGQSKTLAIKVSPKYVTDRSLNFTSSDTSVAVVDHNGRVTGKKTGNVTIQAVYTKNHAVAAKCTVSVSKVKGMLTRQMLNKLNLSSVNNLMIVAHPDDDTIFGGAHLISDKYLVVCMTHGKDNRSVEFNNAMDISKSERIILSYPEATWVKGSLFKKDADFNWDGCQLAIQNDINLLLHYKKWDTVVTHNPAGEYGNIHHKKISKYTTSLYEKTPQSAKRFMYFAKYYEKTQLTNAVKRTLPEINPELYAIKVKMLEAYKSKKYTCFTWLGHIEPYEKWVYYDDWKN